jgi:hypothetical protein
LHKAFHRNEALRGLSIEVLEGAAQRLGTPSACRHRVKTAGGAGHACLRRSEAA